jgi:hypothetical protein
MFETPKSESVDERSHDLPEHDRKLTLDLLHLLDRYVINTEGSVHGRAVKLRRRLENDGKLDPDTDQALSGVCDAAIAFEDSMRDLLMKRFGLTEEDWQSLRQDELERPLARFKSEHDSE